MLKLSMLLGIIWLIGFIFLTVMAFSRFVFDEPPLVGGRGSLFMARVFIAAFWWLMILSPGGRYAIKYLMKGESID